MEVVKPLYGMAEAGTHWWAIYLKHQQEKLRMETSTFDPCLLVTSRENINFGICAGGRTTPRSRISGQVKRKTHSKYTTRLHWMYSDINE